jgi:hypothetical protein
MITESQLREKLKYWIREYGWGGMPNQRSTNLLQTLIDHHGFVPSGSKRPHVPINTVGDEVEDAVMAMASTPAEVGDENVMFKAAMAMRAYYLTPKHWPEEDRIKQLKIIGLPMGRHTYYRCVQLGRAFLLGYLNSREKQVA